MPRVALSPEQRKINRALTKKRYYEKKKAEHQAYGRKYYHEKVKPNRTDYIKIHKDDYKEFIKLKKENEKKST